MVIFNHQNFLNMRWPGSMWTPTYMLVLERRTIPPFDQATKRSMVNMMNCDKKALLVHHKKLMTWFEMIFRCYECGLHERQAGF